MGPLRMLNTLMTRCRSVVHGPNMRCIPSLTWNSSLSSVGVRRIQGGEIFTDPGMSTRPTNPSLIATTTTTATRRSAMDVTGPPRSLQATPCRERESGSAPQTRPTGRRRSASHVTRRSGRPTASAPRWDGRDGQSGVATFACRRCATAERVKLWKLPGWFRASPERQLVDGELAASPGLTRRQPMAPPSPGYADARESGRAEALQSQDRGD